MSTHHYQDQYDSNQTGQNYQHIQWGTTHHPSKPSSHANSHQPHIRYHTDHYQHTPEEPFVVNVDYSQVAAVETGFKKLKSNQIQILKELKREYQVLKNTDLEPGMVETHRHQTESPQSVEESSSKSRSDAQSSSFSRADRTRKKSRNKELQVAALQRKQMEMMLNNSMKKIQQLLASQIELKKTVAELRNKLQSRQNNVEEHEYVLKKHREEIQMLSRALEDSRKEYESYKIKSKENINAIGSLEGELAINTLQLKKKDERIRILEEQIYLEKNKFCNLELDLKKYKLEAQMLQRNHKEELSLLQRRLTSAEDQHLIEKQDQIRKLKNQIDLKEERYKLVLSHLNKEKQEKDELSRRKQDVKVESTDREYIKQLEDLVETLQKQKDRRAAASQEVLTSILDKMSTINSQSNQDLVNQINSLKKQLQVVHSHAPAHNINQEQLQQKIRELERSIQEQNNEKMYFFQDFKKMKDQLISERKSKEEAQGEAKDLRQMLRRVEQQATKYSYELQTLRHIKELDMNENETKSKDVMFKSQMIQNKDLQIAQIRQDMNKILDDHRNQINQYEQQLKLLKRQLAEEEIKYFKIKEELELKLSLNKTEYEAELTRAQDQVQKVKKSNAVEVNDHFNQRIALQEKLLQKQQELDNINKQLNSLLKQKQSYYQDYKAEQDKKVQAIQDDHANNVSQLAGKLEGLAELSNQHLQIVQRNAWLQQQLAEMRRILRNNRTVNEGVDHLWTIKEAEYANIDSIMKALQ